MQIVLYYPESEVDVSSAFMFFSKVFKKDI